MSEDDCNKEWREANERVRFAEQRLARAWSDFAEGKAAPPGPEFIEDVQRLRVECDEQLTRLIQRMIARRKGGAERPQS